MDVKPRYIRVYMLDHPRYICAESRFIDKFCLPLEWDSFKQFYQDAMELGYGIVEISRAVEFKHDPLFYVYFAPLDSMKVPGQYVTKLSDYAPLTPQPGYQEVVEETFGQFTYRTVHKVQGGKFRTRANRI